MPGALWVYAVRLRLPHVCAVNVNKIIVLPHHLIDVICFVWQHKAMLTRNHPLSIRLRTADAQQRAGHAGRRGEEYLALVPNTTPEGARERAIDRAIVELMEEGLTELQARLCAMQEACFDEAPEFGTLGARIGQPISTDLELAVMNEEASGLGLPANSATAPKLLDSPGAAVRSTPRRPGAPF